MVMRSHPRLHQLELALIPLSLYQALPSWCCHWSTWRHAETSDARFCDGMPKKTYLSRCQKGCQIGCQNTVWVLYKNSLYKNLRGSIPRRATYFQLCQTHNTLRIWGALTMDSQILKLMLTGDKPGLTKNSWSSGSTKYYRLYFRVLLVKSPSLQG